jgi:hypothetical protein
MWEVHSQGLPPHHLIIAPGQDPTSGSEAAHDASVHDILTALQESRPVDALSTSRRLLAWRDDHADAWHLAGLAHLYLDQLPQAVASVSRAVTLRPDVAFYRQVRCDSRLVPT